MTEAQTVSWIFLATALASQKGAVRTEEIIHVADFINRAIPTYKEMSMSLRRLIEEGYLDKTGKKYMLTERGKHEYELASTGRQELFKIWAALEDRLEAC